MIRLVLILLLVMASIFASGQSRKEWLDYGDEAFKNGDYASAAYFYQKVLDKNTAGSRDVVYPYEAKPWIKPDKVKTDSASFLDHNSSGLSIPEKFKPADLNHDGYLSPGELKDVMAQTDQGKSAFNAHDMDELTDYFFEQEKMRNPDSIKAQQKRTKNIISTTRYTYVVHQVAESYRLNHDYPNAVIWYEKSLLNKAPEYPDERLWYAVTLINNAKYDHAMQELETYKKENKDSSSYMFRRAEKLLLGCYYSVDPNNVKQGYTVQELDTSINSGVSNFAANFYGDNTELVFTSGRKGNKFPEGQEDNAQYYPDLYITRKTGQGWERPKPMESPINSPGYEAAGVLSINKDLFFFTRWTGPGNNSCAIYVSKFLNNQWLTPMKLNQNVNVEGYNSMQPSLSFDGTKLYFSSNRPGGKGKMDIWMCPLDEFGNAGTAVNLGPRINTPENEVAPFYHDKTTTLYFSSDGLIGFGGLDIYKSYASDEDTLWSTPINMQQPVNSSRDDSYFVLQRDQRVGYFSSDRKMCEGCEGGSCYRIYRLEKEPLVFNISGKVFNSETNEPISTSLITFKDINGDLQPFFVITDENGAYSSPLREDMEFYLKAQKNRFFGDAATVSTKGLSESKDFEQDFFLTPIPAGDIVIRGIEYDYDKATLRPQSKVVLDSLVDFLNLNNNISIEISSHTDTRGSDVYNMNLSKERAKSVVEYLISKGIAKERLLAEGYGETKPLMSDDTIARLKTQAEKEAAHQKNRRTAFRTIKEDAIRTQ